MSIAALVLYVVALVVIFGLRSWVQRRRTGSTGFRGFSGTPGRGRLVGRRAVRRRDRPRPGRPAPGGDRCRGRRSARSRCRCAVWSLALAGFAATLAGQIGMGASWRIGVDPVERTALVTTGVFGVVSNPVFSAMVAAQAGIALMVPTW